VADRLDQLPVGAAFDAELLAARGDAHRARSAGNGQRRLEHAPGKIDAVRRQLGDAVRHDRAREVDGLAARTEERALCETCHLLW
jgi:hypothetical protein